MRLPARSLITPVLAVLLLIAGCGGDDQPGGEATSGTTASEIASIDAEAPTPDELEACLATNGFDPEVDTDSPVYGVASIDVTIVVPGFPAAGAGEIHVFGTADEAAQTFPDLVEDAIGVIELHRNTILDEFGTGAIHEEGADEVRARLEACIGPASDSGGPEA